MSFSELFSGDQRTSFFFFVCSLFLSPLNEAPLGELNRRKILLGSSVIQVVSRADVSGAEPVHPAG